MTTSWRGSRRALPPHRLADRRAGGPMSRRRCPSRSHPAFPPAGRWRRRGSASRSAADPVSVKVRAGGSQKIRDMLDLRIAPRRLGSDSEPREDDHETVRRRRAVRACGACPRGSATNSCSCHARDADLGEADSGEARRIPGLVQVGAVDGDPQRTRTSVAGSVTVWPAPGLRDRDAGPSAT